MNEYDDIIDLPHHKSQKHVLMSKANRAAQFAPFAALTGYESIVAETARLTDRYVTLEDEQLNYMNDAIGKVLEHIKERPLVEITFFQPDDKKNGGSYKTLSGRVRVVDEYEREIIFTDGSRIQMDMICNIEIIQNRADPC